MVADVGADITADVAAYMGIAADNIADVAADIAANNIPWLAAGVDKTNRRFQRTQLRLSATK